MSETETLEQEPEQVERLEPEARPLLARKYEVTDLELDGRNVFLRCAPYDVPTTVVDPPDFVPYEESFARGAFDSALRAPNRIYLEHEHFAPGLSGVIGHGETLESRQDALYGRFRVLRTQDGDKALELIAANVLRAASVYFSPIKNARTATGAIRRLRVRLDRVALCREGSYPGAEVIAVRSALEEPEETITEYERLAPFAPELAGALADQGITIPDRLR